MGVVTATIVGIILFISIPIGLFFAIRSLIRYNAEQKRIKSQKQSEIDKMHISDL